jgi:hypothetical protein
MSYLVADVHELMNGGVKVDLGGELLHAVDASCTRLSDPARPRHPRRRATRENRHR